MADEGVLLGTKALQQIAQTIREVARRMMNEQPHRGRWQNSHTPNRSAVIGTALSAPASSLAVATSCTIYFLDLQSDGTQVLNETPYTAYNDDPEVTAVAGTYCRLEWKTGRWMVYYIGCDSQAALVAVLP